MVIESFAVFVLVSFLLACTSAVTVAFVEMKRELSIRSVNFVLSTAFTGGAAFFFLFLASGLQANGIIAEFLLPPIRPLLNNYMTLLVLASVVTSILITLIFCRCFLNTTDQENS